MSVLTAFRDADSHTLSVRASARRAAKQGKRGGSLNPYSSSVGGSGLSNSANSSIAQHKEQYRYFKDHVYAAVRPIAVRFAGQSIKIGRKIKSSAIPGMVPKEGAKGGKEGKSEAVNQLWKKSAPEWVLKSLGDDGLKMLDVHPALEALQNPNEIHVSWQLKYLTALNLQITGKCYWWIEDAQGDDGKPRIKIWVLPSSWVTPNHEQGLFANYDVRPSTGNESFPVKGEDMMYFAFSDPSDPTNGLSPMQAASKSVTSDEHLQNCQLSHYRNGIRPGVILKAGRLPGMPGQTASGARMIMTPEQRKQLITAIKLAYQGWEKHSDPAIVNGLIEDIVPWTTSPVEMDYLSSGNVMQERIFMTFGTNPIVAGKIEGANRAQAYAAADHLNDYVVNPMIELISEIMTVKFLKRCGEADGDLIIWVEKARAHDADLAMAEMNMGITACVVTKDEVRHYIGLGPLPQGGDELVAGAGNPPVDPNAAAATAVAADAADAAAEAAKKSPPPGRRAKTAGRMPMLPPRPPPTPSRTRVASRRVRRRPPPRPLAERRRPASGRRAAGKGTSIFSSRG